MTSKNLVIETEVTGTEDGKETYCISRTWNKEKKKALVIELYPTITVKNTMCLDKSTVALLNHAEELGWGSIQIVNLYSTVFVSKPLVAQLKESEDNLKHIAEILGQSDITKYDIVIAWGSSLSTHKVTNELKRKVLNLLMERGLFAQVKHIVTEMLMTNDGVATHPLYLLLRHNFEKWFLHPYPIESELKKFNKLCGKESEEVKENSKSKNTKRRSKAQ